MGKEYKSAYAICPYYHEESTQSIVCDGLQEGNTIHTMFSSRTDCKDYKVARCRSRAWEKCPIAKMLTRLYQEGTPT